MKITMVSMSTIVVGRGEQPNEWYYHTGKDWSPTRFFTQREALQYAAAVNRDGFKIFHCNNKMLKRLLKKPLQKFRYLVGAKYPKKWLTVTGLHPHDAEERAYAKLHSNNARRKVPVKIVEPIELVDVEFANAPKKVYYYNKSGDIQMLKDSVDGTR